MDYEEIKQKAKEKIASEGIADRLAERGRLLFLVIGGAHNFGFPSQNSDYDIRGVYQAPTTKFLGMNKNPEELPFEYMSPDRTLDVSVDEIGKYLRLIIQSNGNRIEWPNSPLVLVESPEFAALKETVNKHGINKKLFHHYSHFARYLYQGKTGATGLKKDLYTLRTYMAGINILENGEVVSDITQLNERFKYPLIDRLVALKQKDEHAISDLDTRGEIEKIIGELDLRLVRAFENSSLPEEPNQQGIEDFLIELRRKNI